MGTHEEEPGVSNVQPTQIGPREVVYEDRFQQIYKVTADFGSFKKDYFVRDSGERAGIVVVREESVLLVRQYRFLIDGLSWEVPGGRVDEGETAQAAAIRECLEETGVLCEEIKPLLSYQVGLDSMHNPTHLFYTDVFVNKPGYRPDVSEVQGHEWLPLSRCIDMVFDHQIVDSLSIVALLSYQTLTGQQRADA